MKHPVMQLQEYTHKAKCKLPYYTFDVVRENGEKFHKCTCYVSINGTSVYHVSKCKKEAKAKSAELMLLAMPHLDEFENNLSDYTFV